MMASPREVERYALRLLLFHVKGATKFEDLRQVQGVLHATFSDAAKSMGLLNSTGHLMASMTEATTSGTACQIRSFFASLLMFVEGISPRDAQQVWNSFKADLAGDFFHRSEFFAQTL